MPIWFIVVLVLTGLGFISGLVVSSNVMAAKLIATLTFVLAFVFIGSIRLLGAIFRGERIGDTKPKS